MRVKILAALASPPGEGAIGIIDVFGHGAAVLTDRVFRSSAGRTLAGSRPDDLFYGRIVDGDGIVDEVLIRVASRSPDRLEINCHGGPAPHAAVMGLLEHLGVEKCAWHELISLSAESRALDAIQVEAAERLPDAQVRLLRTPRPPRTLPRCTPPARTSRRSRGSPARSRAPREL